MKRGAMLVAALCALLVGKVVYSFVPVPALLAVSYTAAGGASYATLAALAAGIGAALWSVDIKDQTTGATAMRVRVAPDAPARVPAGWTAASSPANDPVPPVISSTLSLNIFDFLCLCICRFKQIHACRVPTLARQLVCNP